MKVPTLASRLPQHVLTILCATDMARSMDRDYYGSIYIRTMGLANAGHSADLKQRWGHSKKQWVPLEASVADAIRTAIYSGRDTGGRLTLDIISPAPAHHMKADLSVPVL